MDELEAYLKNLKDSIQQLLKQYDHLQKENKILIGKIEEQRIIIATGKEKIDQLEQTIDTGKFGVQDLEEEDKVKLKERIAYYLSDIEKCLSLLNS